MRKKRVKAAILCEDAIIMDFQKLKKPKEKEKTREGERERERIRNKNKRNKEERLMTEHIIAK